MNRLSLFWNWYPHAWFEFEFRYDYHDVVGSVTLLKAQIGFSYVWKKARHGLPKRTHGFTVWA